MKNPNYHVERKSLYVKKYKWSVGVRDYDKLITKHILPKVASDILLPVEELDTMAQRGVNLGKRGELIHNLALQYECGDNFKQKIIRNCLRIEHFTGVIREIAEKIFRGPLPMFPIYDSIFISTEPILTDEEKVDEVFRGVE